VNDWGSWGYLLHRASFHRQLVLLVCQEVSGLDYIVSYIIDAKHKRGLTARKLPSNLYHVVL